MNPFRVGEIVRIIPLGKTGKIIELLGNSNCVVHVGGLKMKCRVSDLRQLERKEATEKKTNIRVQDSKTRATRTSTTPRTIDLHGMDRDSAIRRVEQFISDALLCGYDEVQVIHGHGAGILKEALHRYLSSLSVVSHFALLPTNTGVTRIVF